METLPPPGFPYKWCSASGEDEFGIWLEFTVKNIVQRMRWINPGRFSMGSLDDELHRHHYETQHEVTLSKGFWIADAACSREFEYYESQMAGLGNEFIEEFEKATQRIIQFPEAWHPFSPNTRRCQFNRFPYGILYFVEKTNITILAVAHMHRDPNYWQDRSRKLIK